MSKEKADKFGMVELYRDSQVFVDQETYTLAVNKCSLLWQNPRTVRSETDPSDGKPAARFLLSRFFSREQLLNGTVSKTSGGMPLVPLDKRIIDAIIVGTSGFAEIQNKPEINRRIRGDVSKLEHWLRSRGDTRRAQDIPPVELDVYLVDFLTTAKTRSGGDYDPESLTTLRGNIDRYLKIVSYGHSITTSPLFGLSQAALKQRTDELRAEFSLTLTELMAIKQRQLIDCSCPGSLLRAVYFVNSFFFGNYLKSRGDHCNLRWGDLEIRKDALGKELLVLTGNASRVSGFSSRFIRALGARIVDAAVDQMEDKICPVTIYKEFRRHRPQKSLLPDTKFYLCPITRPHNDNWFELTAMDSLTLGNEVKQLKHTLAQHILNVPNTSEDRATNLGESR